MNNDKALLANGQKVDWGHVQSLQAAELEKAGGINRTLVVQPSHQRQALLPDPDLDRRIGEAAAQIRDAAGNVERSDQSKLKTGHGTINAKRTDSEGTSSTFPDEHGSGPAHYGSLHSRVLNS